MIKELKKFQLKLTPFAVTKNWELSNVDSENLLLLEQTGSGGGDEALALEFVDYGDGSEIPVTGSTCDIALEQQDNNLLRSRDGQKLSGPFYPDSDPQNSDGTYQRSVYAQVNTAFYNQYRNPTELWGIENIDFELSKTKRRITDKLRVWDVPRSVFGDKMIPGSVQFHDPSQDNEYVIQDDTYGNLTVGTNLFSKQQELRKFGNVFLAGSDPTCNSYFNPGCPLPADIYALTASQVGSALTISLNWLSIAPSGFVVERAISLNATEWQVVADNWEQMFEIWNYAATTQSFFTLALGTGVTSSYDTNISYSSTYWYRVYAFNSCGTSSYSNIVSASAISDLPPGGTPSITASIIPWGPINLTVISGSAILNWNSRSINQDYYAIQRSINGVSYSNFSNSTTESYIDTTVTSSPSGTTYWYQVAAVNPAGTSSYSNTASITFTYSPPVGPVSLNCTAGTTASIITGSSSTPVSVPTVLNGTIIVGATSSYKGAGYYSDTQSLNVVSGSTYNVWMRSSQLDSWLVVYSGSTVVAQADNNGWTPTGDVIDDSYVEFSSSINGLYKLEATTYTAGDTGSYTMMIDSGKSKIVTNGGAFVDVMIYVSSSNLIIASDEQGPTMSVIRAQDNVLTSFINPNSGNSFGTPVPDVTDDMDWSPVQNKIYGLCIGFRNPGPHVTYLLELNLSCSSILGIITSSVRPPNFSSDMAYDSKNDRMLIISDDAANTTPKINWEIINLATSSSLISGSFGAFPKQVWSAAYCVSTNDFWITSINTSGQIYRMNADTFAITTSSFVGGGTGYPIFYIESVDRLFTVNNGSPVKLCSIVPSSQAVEYTFNEGTPEGITYNPCRNELVITYWTKGVYCYNATTYAPSRFFNVTTANHVQGPAFAEKTSKTYVIDRDNADIYYFS